MMTILHVQNERIRSSSQAAIFEIQTRKCTIFPLFIYLVKKIRGGATLAGQAGMITILYVQNERIQSTV